MRASSPSLIESCDAPTTRTLPSTSSRSCSAASSTWLASFLALSATARAASSTDEPAVTVWRLANAPSPSDTPPVSPGTPVMCCARRPRSPAPTCANAGGPPVPTAGGPGEYGHASRIRYPHQAGLERTTPGPLDAVREPDAEIAALSSRGGLTLGKVLPTRRLQDLRLAGRIVAAVVAHTGAGARLERLGVRHLLRWAEIAAAHLHAREPEFARRAVHQPCHGEGRLGIAGPAHR